MSSYLDSSGLSHFWAKVKTILSGKQDSLTIGDGLSLKGNTIDITDPVRGVTKAEYDALTEDQKNSGLYVLTDVENEVDASGATFTPSVSAEGELSWTNDKGLPNPEPVNIKGPKGDIGDTGEIKSDIVYGPAPEVVVEINVANTKLTPVSQIAVHQEGTGVPSVDNVRNIIPRNNITLTHNEVAHNVDFPEPVYAGEYDWSSGKLTVTHKIFELAVKDMNEKEDYPGWKNVVGLEECFEVGTTHVTGNYFLNVGTEIGINMRGGNRILFLRQASYGLTQTEWMERYPDLIVQVVFPLLTPKIVPIMPQEFIASIGANTFSSNCGDTTVSYYTDINSFVDYKLSTSSIYASGTGISIQNNIISATTDVYSTEETVIGTWIDGKPLYRSVFSYNLSETDGSAITFSIPGGVAVDSLIKLVGYARAGSGSLIVANSGVTAWDSAGSSLFICLNNTGSAIYTLSQGTDLRGRPITIILEYTKTTDIATVSQVNILTSNIETPETSLSVSYAPASASSAKLDSGGDAV